MKLSDERRELFELYTSFKKSGAVSGQLAEFIDLLFSVIDKNEEKVIDLEDRIAKLEEFSEIISMDLFDIQSAMIKGIKSDGTDNEGTDIFADFADDDDCDDDCDCEDGHCSCGHHHHEDAECECDDEDEEENKFIRCPYCNTLIFPNGDEERLECPFCGEKFLLSDVQ